MQQGLGEELIELLRTNKYENVVDVKYKLLSLIFEVVPKI